MKFFTRPIRFVVLTVAASVCGAGCVTPDYLQPGGYSSTFHKVIKHDPELFPPSPNLGQLPGIDE